MAFAKHLTPAELETLTKLRARVDELKEAIRRDMREVRRIEDLARKRRDKESGERNSASSGATAA